MRKLASIQRIKEVLPIEGADRIELVKVLGWQCVSNKGAFKEGDLCVYFEIDSFLPIKENFEFLHKTSYKVNELLGEGFRLKTIRLKGEISQGLVLPVTDFPELSDCKEGDDVTELLGVRKWEISERATTGGTIIGQLPESVVKTDETRIQSEPELFEEFRGIPYYITTKLDGSSHSISIDREGVFHVTGHNYEYKDDDSSSFYRYVKENNLEEILRNYMAKHNIESMTVQGEWCGSGIQGNKLKLKQPDWFFFSIYENGRRVGLSNMAAFNTYLEVEAKSRVRMVPVEEIGDDLPEDYPTIEALLERASKDTSGIYQGGQPEGIVIRPLEPIPSKTLYGAPLSMKVINNKYLLKDS